MTYHAIVPHLSTADVDRLVRFYLTATDAVITYRAPTGGDPEIVLLALAAGALAIRQDPGSPGPASVQRAALWFQVEDCDQAFGQFLQAGADAVDEPTRTSRGERVATVVDPDGNVLQISQEPAPRRAAAAT